MVSLSPQPLPEISGHAHTICYGLYSSNTLESLSKNLISDRNLYVFISVSNIQHFSNNTVYIMICCEYNFFSQEVVKLINFVVFKKKISLKINFSSIVSNDTLVYFITSESHCHYGQLQLCLFHDKHSNCG